MKLIHFLVFFCLVGAGTTQLSAQNKSAENSDVILNNEWWESLHVVNCDVTGTIIIYAVSHVTHKQTPSGNWSGHYNIKGEGFDEFGREWTFHETDNYVNNEFDIHYTSIATLHGPKGAQLKMRIQFIEKDGKLQIEKFEPYCE